MIKKIMVTLSVFCASSYGMQQEGKSVQDLIDTNKAPSRLHVVLGQIEPGQEYRPRRIMLSLNTRNLTSLEGLENLQITGTRSLGGSNIPKPSGEPYTLDDVNIIYLYHNKLSSISPEPFKKFEHLRRIGLTGNPLSDEQIKQLRKELPKVEIIFKNWDYFFDSSAAFFLRESK